jgi:hypothetical protein
MKMIARICKTQLITAIVPETKLWLNITRSEKNIGTMPRIVTIRNTHLAACEPRLISKAIPTSDTTTIIAVIIALGESSGVNSNPLTIPKTCPIRIKLDAFIRLGLTGVVI